MPPAKRSGETIQVEAVTKSSTQLRKGSWRWPPNPDLSPAVAVLRCWMFKDVTQHARNRSDGEERHLQLGSDDLPSGEKMPAYPAYPYL